MEITILGTSDMKPTAKRNQTAILLKREGESILFDCGEGTQRQFRTAKQNPCKLTRLLITHWHGDHVLGISGLLQTLAQSEYPKTLYIYGPVGTKRYFHAIMSLFHFVGSIKTVIKEINKEGKFFENEDFILEAFKMKHGCPCLAYSFNEKDKIRIDKEAIRKYGLSGPIVGELQKGKSVKFNGKIIKAKDVIYIKKGKKIAVVLDTLPCEGCYKAAENSDILIAEATFSHELEDKAAEYSHLTANQIAHIAKKSNVRKLMLTHISQRYGGNEKKILEEAKKIFKNTELAEDLMKIVV